MNSEPPIYFDLPSGSSISHAERLQENASLFGFQAQQSPPSSVPWALSHNSHSESYGRGIWEYIRRMRHVAQMDWEYTMWQMVYVCFQPKKVYHTTKYHKQTKNQWARDDPGFVVLMLGLLCFAVLSWSLALANNMSQFLKMLFYVPIIDFILLSIIISTINWAISNKFLQTREKRWKKIIHIHVHTNEPFRNTTSEPTHKHTQTHLFSNCHFLFSHSLHSHFPPIINV